MEYRTQKTPSWTSGAILWSVLGLAACSGGGASGTCDTLGTCGGDPVGTWQVVSACTNPVAQKPQQAFAVPESGIPLPPTTSGGWCWDISWDPNDPTKLFSPGTPPPIPNPTVVDSGTVSFTVDPMTGEHKYTYALNAWSRTEMHIARSCLGANATMSCDTLAKQLQDLNGVDAKYEKRHDAAGGQNFLCTTVADGCDCSFDYTETDQNASGDKGAWEVKNGVIYHYSESYVLTTSFRTEREANFCVTNGGQTMELSGYHGTTLSLKANLRSLTLQKIP